MKFSEVQLNKYGFYEVIEKPTEKELERYYSEKYYQENKGSYEISYSDADMLYFANKNAQKLHVVKSILPKKVSNKFLDVGCGEGYALQTFLKNGWEVLGLDYSDFGCTQCNPDCLPFVIKGDIYISIENLIADTKKFDVLLLDNVLEHVLNPKVILEQCAQLLTKDGVLIIEVPNDFSILQQYLLDTKKVEKPFWIALPDHISYFNLAGLTNLLNDVGFDTKLSISDHPIDFNLLNKDTNYSMDKSKGKGCHQSRVELENLIHSISIDKAIDLYKAYANLGLGRQIVSFSTLK